MLEKVFVGVVGQENDISTLGARRILTEYKIPYEILNETDLANEINRYSLLLIDISKKSSNISEHIEYFLEMGGSVICYSTLNLQNKNFLNLDINENFHSSTSFRLLLGDDHPIVIGIEKREVLIMTAISLITDCTGYNIVGEFICDNKKIPSIIVSKQKNLIYIPFDICQQIIIWETENYGKVQKLNPVHSIISKTYNSLPYSLKINIKVFSRKVRRRMVNKSVGYTNFPIEYNSDTLRTLLINSIRYLCISSVGFLPALSKWPSKYDAAMVITHDVDTHDDYKNGLPVLRGIEDRHNVKSTWCFVAKGSEYDPSPTLLSDLASNGHEIVSHGLYHDIRSDLLVGAERKERMNKSKEILESCLKRYSIRGYRSPGLTRTSDLCLLVENTGYEYDMSYPDNDHYNLIHFGMGVSSHIPYHPIIKQKSGYKELNILELPLSALQEATIFIDHKLSEKEAVNFWIKKGEQIISDGGLVVFLFHPSNFMFESRAKMYELLISHFKSKSNLYMTTSNNIVEWWKQRELIEITTRKSGEEEWEITITNKGESSVSGVKLEIYTKKKEIIKIIKGNLELIESKRGKWHTINYLKIESIKNSERIIIRFSCTEEEVL